MAPKEGGLKGICKLTLGVVCFQFTLVILHLVECRVWQNNLRPHVAFPAALAFLVHRRGFSPASINIYPRASSKTPPARRSSARRRQSKRAANKSENCVSRNEQISFHLGCSISFWRNLIVLMRLKFRLRPIAPGAVVGACAVYIWYFDTKRDVQSERGAWIIQMCWTSADFEWGARCEPIISTACDSICSRLLYWYIIVSHVNI